MQKIAFGLITVFTTVSLAQGGSTSLTGLEFGQLTQELSNDSQNPANVCALALLKDKKANQVLRIPDEYGQSEDLGIEVTIQDLQKTSKICDLIGASYFEILVNAGNKNGVNLYRMRNSLYIQTSFGMFLKIYSPFFNQVGINQAIQSLRSSYPTKTIDMGLITSNVSLQKVTVQKTGGDELVLASIEDRLVERTAECAKYAKDGIEETCEESSYSIELKWAFNNFISYNVTEGVEYAKYDSGFIRIVSVGQSRIENIKDIRDIFSEQDLLGSLKQDWIIRNSNKWTQFSKAQTWDQFWNFTEKEYYGFVSEFQSYSNRLNTKQVEKVRKCAELAGSVTGVNSGYMCAQKKDDNARVFMFDYQISRQSLSENFEIYKMDATSVYVKIPLTSGSTGSANIHLKLPKREKDTYSRARIE